MVDGSACEVINTGTVNVTERDGTMVLWRDPVCPEGMVQSNIHRSTQRKKMLIQVQQYIVTVSQGE